VNLFAACSVAKITLEKIIPQLVWFVLTIIICLLLITYIPAISLFPVELFYGDS
jgi:C4-dicarboxylate transporter DctM subunit